MKAACTAGAFVLGLGFMLAGQAAAQSFPSKPVRIIVTVRRAAATTSWRGWSARS
jgi:hypothetical protein